MSHMNVLTEHAQKGTVKPSRKCMKMSISSQKLVCSQKMYSEYAHCMFGILLFHIPLSIMHAFICQQKKSESFAISIHKQLTILNYSFVLWIHFASISIQLKLDVPVNVNQNYSSSLEFLSFWILITFEQNCWKSFID